MLNNKQLNSIFSISEEESDYEEEAEKQYQKTLKYCHRRCYNGDV